MAQLSNVKSFKNIENTLDKISSAAWVWDADRNRIIAANGRAVKFWQELSVLDLIDTLFGEFHPISLQFAKAKGLIGQENEITSQIVDFTSMDITEKIDCEFSALANDENRQIILIKIADLKTETADPENETILASGDAIAKMLDNAPAALALFDQEGQFCYANTDCQQIFTRTGTVFSNPNHLSDWFVGDEQDPDKVKTTVENLIEKCLNYKVANISAKINTAFGARTHSVIAKSFAVKPFNDGQQYVLIYLRDVADERHYEQILVERIAKLEQLTKLGSDFYFILDDELDFVQLGGNFEKLTGYPASDLLGESWETVADRFNLDPDGAATEYFTTQKSFDNLSINWPVKDTETGLSLTWRGRSLYEQQNGENIFVGSFVTAFENILAVADDELSDDEDIHSYSEHIELVEDGDENDFELDEEDNDTAELIDTLDDADGFDDLAEISALAELDGATQDAIDAETDNHVADADEDKTDEDAYQDEEVDAQELPQQTSDLELSSLETDLSETEAVNFAAIGDTLNENIDDQKPEEDEREADNSDSDISEVIARSDDVIAEINDILGEESEPAAEENVHLADNIVPAFGTTAADIARFGQTEIDMFKLVLDQTPVMAAVTSLPSEEGIYTLFANKEILRNLGLIQDKSQELDNGEYADILSVESMEYLNSLKDEFDETPIDQEISFLVGGVKHYFNAKINKIDWQDNKALQLILSPKMDMDSLTGGDLTKLDNAEQDDLKTVLALDAETLNSEKSTNNDVSQFVLDGQAFIDSDRNIVSANVYLTNLLGMTKEDLVGTPIGSIIAEVDFNNFQDYANSVLQLVERNLSQEGVELELINKTGENHSVYMHMQRLDKAEAENFPSDILVNMRDISMWKKREDNLRDAKDRAEQENVQKSGFLARISHELRTPLNAIIGFSEVMSDEKFGPLENTRYKGYAHDINESGEHLLSLINDLLDLSKIEAGKVELNFKAMELEPLMLQAVALMQPMADKKRIIIRTSISSTLPQIIADMRSIRQIILNLLSNSIKYSNSGSQIILSALLDDDGEVIIRVRDTGLGMDEAQLSAAMEPFKTLNMSNVSDSQSTGLGLPLTKALAEANRADFSIESAKDAGTLVQITFPTTRVLNG